MKDKNFQLFAHLYNPSFTLSLAEKKHNRKDILLFYENRENQFVYCCSDSIARYGIKPGLSVSFAKKLTDNFFLLPSHQFIEEKNYLKNLIIETLKEYAFAIYDIPSTTVNPFSYDCISLVVDFSGCQLLYKPIFIFLNSIFKSILKLDKRLSLSFLISSSFSFSLYSLTGILHDFSKNILLTFYDSNQFSNLVKLSSILSPITFFEESGILSFSDFIKFPLFFQDKLLELSLLSSPLSSKIKLASRLKPLVQPFKSIKKTELLDIFIFNFIQKIYGKNINNKYEILLNFSPATNNKELIYSQIRKKLFLESYFLKNYWLKNKNSQIFVTFEYINQYIDHFSIIDESNSILCFFNFTVEAIIDKIKSKTALSSIRIEFDKTSCQQLFEDNSIEDDEKLLELFENLIHRFGEEKVYFAK